MKSYVLAVVTTIVYSLNINAQEIPPFPPGAEAFFKQVMPAINPKHSKWVRQSSVEVNEMRMSDELLMNKANSYGVLGSISGADIEALAFLVLMQAAKSAQEDLKGMMAKVKSINEQKKKLRESLQKAQSSQVKNSFQLDSLKFLTRKTAAFLDYANPDTVKFQKSRTVGKITKAELDNQIDQVKNDLDSMSEMGEMESLRLQMAMDRMSKMMSTLSNLLKKISDTANQITQNLK